MPELRNIFASVFAITKLTAIAAPNLSGNFDSAVKVQANMYHQCVN